MEKVIEVKGLVKRYGEVKALDAISFDVYRGEIFTLIGPNGAGKTTTVEILEGIRSMDEGEVRVLGYDPVKDGERVKERIGVVPQDFFSFENLTVMENVKLIADIFGRRDRVKEYLEVFGLWEIRKRKFKTLSGGMKKRVAICMALVSDPEIVFLDEPTTGLDPESRRELWKIIRKLRDDGKTIFLTTHYMEEAEKLSDRVCVLVNGRVVAMGTVTELLERYGGGYRVRSEARGEEVIRRHSKEVKVADEWVVGHFSNRKDAARVLLELYALDIEGEMLAPTLEDVFLRLVGRRINERGDIE